MVPPKNQHRSVKSFASRHLSYAMPKVRRPHAGITTFVIYLVRSGFDQEMRTILKRLIDRGLKYPLMR
jgi:hypothetical protein